MGFTGFMYMECFPGQSGLQTLLAAQGRFWGKPCLEASWALECCYWYWWGKEHHSSQPDQSHWKSEKEVYWIQKPWHSSKTLPSKVIPQTLPLAARRVWGPDSVCTQDQLSCDQFLQEQLFMKSALIKSTLSCMPKVDRSWCVSWPVGFEGIHTNDGVSGILPTDICQNSLACHPTGRPKYPKSRWANRILHCHLAKWKLSTDSLKLFQSASAQNQQPCWGMAFKDEESHQQTSPKRLYVDWIHPKRGGSDQGQDSELLVWSYSSATDTPYEGGEKDTDSLWPLQHRRLDSKWIPSSYQAPWTFSTILLKYLISFVSWF